MSKFCCIIEKAHWEMDWIQLKKDSIFLRPHPWIWNSRSMKSIVLPEKCGSTIFQVIQCTDFTLDTIRNCSLSSLVWDLIFNLKHTQIKRSWLTQFKNWFRGKYFFFPDYWCWLFLTPRGSKLLIWLGVWGAPPPQEKGKRENHSQGSEKWHFFKVP